MSSIQDVAHRAGVSATTVSRVLADAPGAERISDATRKAVVRAASDLNYRGNAIARALRTGRTHTIGVLAPDVPSPFLSAILSGAESVLHANGYHMLISVAVAGETEAAPWVSSFIQRIDGALVAGGGDTTQGRQLVRRLIEQNRGAVLVGIAPGDAGIPAVMVDNVSAATEAVDHLIGLGHRHIAFIGCDAVIVDSSSRDRLAGYRSALAEADIPFDDTLVADAPDPIEGCGYEQARDLLARCPDLTAIVTFNDFIALGAMRAGREAGRRLPEDLSVVGFDDMPWAAHSEPALTSVRQPLGDVGKLAANALIRTIKTGGKPDAGDPVGGPDIQLLSAELVRRRSTAPPR